MLSWLMRRFDLTIYATANFAVDLNVSVQLIEKEFILLRLKYVFLNQGKVTQ